MSTARKFAWTAGIGWLVIGAVFFTLFLATGPEAFHRDENQPMRLIMAAVIACGYALNIVLLRRSRKARRAGILDERDEAVARKASEASLSIFAGCAFVASLALYEIFNAVGAVPVGWLYLMAYGGFALISFIHAVATLVADYAGLADG